VAVVQGRAYDVIIVGAGIAGASLAYFLSRRGLGDVVVLEREAQPGSHTTARSAATLVELDPIPTLRRLKVLGARFLLDLPHGFSANPILDAKGALSLYPHQAWSALEASMPQLAAEGLALKLLTPRQASDMVGGCLVTDAFAGAALAERDGFIDVHELLSSYMTHAVRGGVEIRCGTTVTDLLVERERCVGVVTDAGPLRARVVVNAAGPWVGEIAQRSGALDVGFRPLRRCIAVYPPPAGIDMRHWPIVWSDHHRFYFRSESNGVLFCPMDEELMPPCEPAPDDRAIAAGFERLRTVAPAVMPEARGHRWAGLRTFSPDRIPVVGDDPRLPGLFWLAGQGGCGIETSGALGAIAADLIATGGTDRFDSSLLSPGRFIAEDARCGG